MSTNSALPRSASVVIVIVLILIGIFVLAHTAKQIAIIGGNAHAPQSARSAGSVVTMAEYKQVQVGMTYPEVSAIIGAAGEEASSSLIANIHTAMYSWTNSNGSGMNAIFQNGNLVSKAQYSLP
ncbi:MAG: hypothetical protein WC486_00170 [Candidatus Omnitrophota bacterium]